MQAVKLRLRANFGEQGRGRRQRSGGDVRLETAAMPEVVENRPEVRWVPVNTGIAARGACVVGQNSALDRREGRDERHAAHVQNYPSWLRGKPLSHPQ